MEELGEGEGRGDLGEEGEEGGFCFEEVALVAEEEGGWGRGQFEDYLGGVGEVEEIGAVEVVGEELCFDDDEVGRGKAVLYHLLDDSCV